MSWKLDQERREGRDLRVASIPTCILSSPPLLCHIELTTSHKNEQVFNRTVIGRVSASLDGNGHVAGFG